MLNRYQFLRGYIILLRFITRLMLYYTLSTSQKLPRFQQKLSSWVGADINEEDDEDDDDVDRDDRDDDY